MSYADIDSDRANARPNLLVLGYARHGKDTVGEILRDKYGFKFTSSSMFVAQEVLWENWGCAVYKDFEEMYEDRVNHRVLWMQMISAYNTPDKTKTASTMIERGFDMYVGMRRQDELDACREKGVFDYVVWVDASDRHPPERPACIRCSGLPEQPQRPAGCPRRQSIRRSDCMGRALRAPNR